MKLTRDTGAALMAVAAIVIVVGLGFWKTRGPGSQRLIRADEKRIQSIGQLAGQINYYFGQHSQKLPASLNEEQKQAFKDPLTGREPEYAPGATSEFALGTDVSTQRPEDYKDFPYEFWPHPQGHERVAFEAGGRIPQDPTVEF